MENRKGNSSKRKQVIVDHNLDGPSHVICLPASLCVSEQHLLPPCLFHLSGSCLGLHGLMITTDES
jgi:hypothetical protein